MEHSQHIFPVDPEYRAVREGSRSRHARRVIRLYDLLSDEIPHTQLCDGRLVAVFGLPGLFECIKLCQPGLLVKIRYRPYSD